MASNLKLIGDLGVGGERGMVFLPTGYCPCESATQYKDPIKVMMVEIYEDNNNEPCDRWNETEER